MPTPNGQVPTATVATTFCLAVWITETSPEPISIGMFPARRAGYPNSAALRLFVEGAQLAPARAEAGAVYARAVALFDGNDADELAAARAQWEGA